MAVRIRVLARLTLLSLGLLVALGSTAGAQAPAHVEVVNDPSLPVPVNIGNPVLEVYVDNDPSEPIPVTLEATPEVPILITLYEWDYTLFADAIRVESVYDVCVGVQPVCSQPSGRYYVPDGKVLVIESTSVSASVNNGAAPTMMAADVAIQPPGGSEFVFAAGRADYVHPQSKTWQTNFTGTLRAGSGSQVRGGVFWNGSVDGASATVSISGVLLDAPGGSASGDLVASGSVDKGSNELGTSDRSLSAVNAPARAYPTAP